MDFNLKRFKNFTTRKFTCEIVTPMFIGGANPNKAELRTASIKGALRFWWRALHPFYDLKTLKVKEAERFGDANETGKSRLKIVIRSKKTGKPKGFSPLPHRRDVRFRFNGFPPDGEFSVELHGTEEDFLLFELFTILGGLGKRSRRGFGSIRIKKMKGENYPQNIDRDRVSCLLETLTGNSFLKTDGNKITLNLHNININENKYPFIKSIEFGDGCKSYEMLLEIIGKSSHDNNSECTGFTRGRERFSSPVYVSIAKEGDSYFPVITTLNMAYRYELNCSDKADNFKKQILEETKKRCKDEF